jgi:hypothetical protein
MEKFNGNRNYTKKNSNIPGFLSKTYKILEVYNLNPNNFRIKNIKI